MINGNVTGRSFAVRAINTHLSQLILNSIVANRCPIAVATETDAHWNVIYGVETAAGPHATTIIKRIWRHNPVPHVPDRQGHHEEDACISFPRIAMECMKFDELQSAIRRPRDPSFRFQGVVETTVDSQAPQVLPPPQPPDPVSGGVGRDRAMSIAEEQSIDEEIRSKLELGDGPVAADAPIFVRSLDELDSDYYIVPLHTSRGVIGLSRVDAIRPWVRSVGFFINPVSEPFPSLLSISPQALLDLLPDDSASQLETIIASWNDHLARARFVWKSCRESFSPYKPLLEFREISPSIPIAYATFDGEDSVRFTTHLAG